MSLNRTGFYPLLMLVGGMFAALAAGLLIVILTLNPPQSDVQLLFLFMGGSGSVSIMFIYLLYRTGVIAAFSSLRLTLLTTIILMAGLIFLNVWVTAQLMFISYHDLILTTALLIFAGVVAAISIFFVSGVWIDRIDALRQAAERLARGDFKSRLEVRGNDELAQLIEVFNRAVDALQSADEQKRQLEQTRRDLVAWVSHDLRTPLASIGAMNEAMMDGIVTDEETVMRYQRTIQQELHHLRRMIDDLFDLAQLDTRHLRLTFEPSSLRDLVSDTLGSLNAQAAKAGVTLKAEFEPAVDVIKIAPDKVQRVLYNLMDNALRHTPHGGTVMLRVRRKAHGVEVSIHNPGAPIPPADLPHIFDSFYRGEPSRAQTQSGYRGTGLGLAIVRGFIEAHGGQIHVTSTAGQGTTFTFTL